MKKFKVEVVHYLIETVTILANTESDAIIIAKEMPEIGAYPDLKDHSHTGYFGEDPEHY